MNAPVVFLDTETTGLHADRRPWEIAMIRRDDKGEREMVIQVEDVDLSNAELIGLKIGGFFDRHVGFCDDSAPFRSVRSILYTEDLAARRVEAFTRGAHIVGAVPNFDTECLSAMLRRHKLIPSWHYHLIDIEAMAMGHLAGIWKQASAEGELAEPGPFRFDFPLRSDDLSRACNVEPPTDAERHTAMGDARWVQRWYDAITGGAA